MQSKIILSAIAFSLALIAPVQAGRITNLQLYDGTSASPTVTVDYTNANGAGGNSAYTYADPQVSSGTSNPIYYCVDLWHENNLGSTYTINSVASLTFSTSTFTDADNRIGWLLAQGPSTVDARAATQLAIWYTVDNVTNSQLAGFSYSGGDAALRSDYNALIGFKGYDPAVQYGADFWQATHDPTNTLYQNLVSAPGVVNIASVPEPGSLVLAGIGLLTVAGVRRWRRVG